ncbi:MAG: hypothetical protein AAF654_07270 [Myxococcota bacterium]
MACEITAVDRVLLVRWTSSITDEDWTYLLDQVRQQAEGQEQVIFCVDCRALTRRLDETRENQLRQMFESDNPKLLRSAILVEANEFMLQLNEVIRNSRNPNRRVLYTDEALLEWLTPVLSPKEKKAVHAMISRRR